MSKHPNPETAAYRQGEMSARGNREAGVEELSRDAVIELATKMGWTQKDQIENFASGYMGEEVHLPAE